MSVIVQKYGGSSLADTDSIKRIAQQIAARWAEGKLSPRQLRVELVEYYKRAGAKVKDIRSEDGSFGKRAVKSRK